LVEAENENTPLGGGFRVLNFHEPGVSLKPWPVIVPVPVTLRNPLPCMTMEDAVRLNVNPPTLQRLASGPELKVRGAAIVTVAPTVTYVAKAPDRLTTVGFAPFPLSHPITRLAVLTEVVLSSAPPLMLMEPVIDAGVGVAVAVAVAVDVAVAVAVGVGVSVAVAVAVGVNVAVAVGVGVSVAVAVAVGVNVAVAVGVNVAVAVGVNVAVAVAVGVNVAVAVGVGV
jgi:hypothetical protein